MANIISYNDIIELLTDISRRHYQINTFFVGKDEELGNNGDLTYPVFQVYPEFAKMPINAYKEYKTLEFTLRCKVIDLTANDDSNLNDAHSDTLRIAQDIVNELNTHPFYVRSNVNMINDISFVSLEQFEDDITCGWSFALDLRVINANTFCGLPIDPITGYSANGPSSSGNWVYTGVGGVGATGPTGPQGLQGPTGPSGISGTPSLSDVLIAGNSTGGLAITSPNTFNNLIIDDNGVALQVTDNLGTLTNTFQMTNAGIYIPNNGTNSTFYIDDKLERKGLVYYDDYSANFTPESLISKRYVDTHYVPYIGATQNVDLGTWALNAGSIKVNGTNGAGHIHLKHQASDAPSQANSTTIFADVNGDFKWKNDGLYYTTFKTSLNTADRIYTMPDVSDNVVVRSSTDTLTNKTVVKRVVTTTQSATPSINTNNGDIFSMTGLASNVTSFTTNLSGTPVHGQMISIEITDNGVARTLTWGSSFSNSGSLSLPTTTVISTLLRCLFQYNSATLKWEIIASV